MHHFIFGPIWEKLFSITKLAVQMPKIKGFHRSQHVGFHHQVIQTTGHLSSDANYTSFWYLPS